MTSYLQTLHQQHLDRRTRLYTSRIKTDEDRLKEQIAELTLKNKALSDDLESSKQVCNSALRWVKTLEAELTIARGYDVPVERKIVSVSNIIDAICAELEFTKPDLLAMRRSKDYVRARKIGYFLSKKWTIRSLPEIGRIFGDRDHSTVMHGIQTVTENMPAYAETISAIEKRMGLS
jgi:chromosomal replication initiator protein